MRARSVPARALTIGAAAVAVYLAVALGMLTLGGHRVLPLFEGIGPPARYEWVNPPAEFAAGNRKPGVGNETVKFTAGKTPATVLSSPDSQFIVNLPAGAFAPHGADTAVKSVITPLDPATLGRIPAGLASDGNAYRIELTYQPSETAVSKLTVPGNVIINAPHSAEVILYSADGKSWSRLVTQSAGSLASVGARFTAPGWYQVGANPAVVTGAGGGGASHSQSNIVFLAIGAGILAIIVAVVARIVYVRRRQAEMERATGPARRPPRPGQQPAKRASSGPPNRRRPPPKKRR
jgi:hypothetical protein